MREDFLHFLWKFKKFQATNIKTDTGEPNHILALGEHNQNSGPDFFNAKIKIGEQLWAGNVEIHLKSSDWYFHQHETDKAYDNVILHVVWENDVPVYRKNNTVIPTFELKKWVKPELISNYNHLFQVQKKWINCENDFQFTNDFLLKNWLERLYFERLEQKTNTIMDVLVASNNDWEAILFKMLCRSFGSKINSEAFLSLADSFGFSVVRKTRHRVSILEALFFGQAGLLEEDSQTAYHQQLKGHYLFLKQKFGLNNNSVLPIQFFRLRPLNFPTIRLAQLASLCHSEQHLFSKILETKSKEDFYLLFQTQASNFWSTHYTFNATSKYSKKTISKAFIDLLLLNTIIPLVFCYRKQHGNENEDVLLDLAKSIKTESNSIISGFKNLNFKAKSALESQSLIQLKTHYCEKNLCLQCAIGNSLLSG